VSVLSSPDQRLVKTLRILLRHVLSGTDGHVKQTSDLQKMM
jgi:hypothetical protein